MNYQLKFIEGELAGQVFPLGKDAIGIGRSRQNDIILSDEDISRKHIIVSYDGSNVHIENLSAGKTFLNKTQVKLGDNSIVIAGQEVTLGKSNTFILEVSPPLFTDSDDKTSFTSSPDSDTVAFNASEDASQLNTGIDVLFFQEKNDNNEDVSRFDDNTNEEQTVGMQTRMATPEEVEYIKRQEEKTFLFKKILLAAIFILFLVCMGVYSYFFLFKAPEKNIEWAKDINGQPLIGTYWIKALPAPAFFALIYPTLPGKQQVKVTTQKDYTEIHSKIGRNSDIDIFIGVECKQDVKFLNEERDITFSNWVTSKSQGTESWNFEMRSPLNFFSRDKGIPYIKIGYSRNRGNILWSGYAYFIRYADFRIVLTVEIPASEKWRGNQILSNNFIAFDDGFLFTHWEGFSSINEMPAEQLIDEAALLLSRSTPALWQRIEYLLRSALVKCKISGDTKNAKNAQKYLIQLRLAQIKWYNMQKIAYGRFNNLQDIEGKKRIEILCRAVFSSPDDMRYFKVRKNDWK